MAGLQVETQSLKIGLAESQKQGTLFASRLAVAFEQLDEALEVTRPLAGAKRQASAVTEAAQPGMHLQYQSPPRRFQGVGR